jgi:valyl-tRNA synthetase
LEIFVDLAGLLDVEAELQRLAKEQTQIETQIKAKQQKLSNDNFVGRAPVDVVQRERDSLRALSDQLESLKQALATLQRN